MSSVGIGPSSIKQKLNYLYRKPIKETIDSDLELMGGTQWIETQEKCV